MPKFRSPADAGSSKQVCLLLLICFIAAALRLYGLADEGLWYDEGCSIYLSDYASRCDRLLNMDYCNDPPLFLVLLLGWRRILSSISGSLATDFMLRLLPCFFSVITVPAVYGAFRGLLQYRTTPETSPQDSRFAELSALAAAFLVAVSPFHRYYAQELRCYSLLTFLAVLVLWNFIAALRDNRLWQWITLTLLLSLSLWTHFFSAWLFLVLDLYLLLTFRAHKKRYIPWALCHIAALLLSLPALLLAWRMSQVVAAIAVQWIPPPGLKTLFITFKTFFAGYSPRSLVYWPLFLLSAGLCLFGVRALRHSRQNLLLLLLWAGLPMVSSAVLWRIRDFSYYELRLFIWCAPAAALLAACGWASMRFRTRIVIGSVFLLLTGLLLSDGMAHALHPVPQHRLGVRYKVDNRGAARYLASYAFAGEPVYHSSHVTLPSFRFYLPGHEHTHICLTRDDREGFFSAYPNRPLWTHLNFQPTPWHDLASFPRSFWLVRSWWEPFELPENLFLLEKEIEQQCVREEELAFFGITLIHYQRRGTPSGQEFLQ